MSEAILVHDIVATVLDNLRYSTFAKGRRYYFTDETAERVARACVAALPERLSAEEAVDRIAKVLEPQLSALTEFVISRDSAHLTGPALCLPSSGAA